MLATFKGFFLGVLATIVVLFAATALLGAGTKSSHSNTLGESCKQLKVIVEESPKSAPTFIRAEAAALKMDVDFYLKWCKRLDK